MVWSRRATLAFEHEFPFVSVERLPNLMGDDTSPAPLSPDKPNRFSRSVRLPSRPCPTSPQLLSAIDSGDPRAALISGVVEIHNPSPLSGTAWYFTVPPSVIS